ncbi:unnamed protein product, partial [Clonostachys chloroleuca]
NYPNSDDSTNANKLTHSKDEPKSHGDSTANPCPVNELDFGYLRGFGPENRADFTNFTFAAKEDIEGPGISSVSPLRPQENNADIDHGGQFDGAALNNANISTPDQNSRLQSTEGNEPNGNIPRRGNVTRLYMPPRDRRCPRNDGYVSERTLEEYMNSDTQSEQMNNGTENMEEGPSESTKWRTNKLDWPPAHSDADLNATTLPLLRIHYFLLLDRGTGVDPVPEYWR